LESFLKAEIWRGTLKGAKTGFLAGLCLAALYLMIGALGDTELTKSLAYSLLLVGFPTLFAWYPLCSGWEFRVGCASGWR
jgi:hypothetical protein